MNSKAETWLRERMTVRRWLMAVGGIGVLAVCTAYGAVVMLRPDDTDGGGFTIEGASEQRPTAVCITSNVGSFSVLDGRAAVTLDVYPTRLPMEWSVTVRTVAATPGSTPREIDLKGPEVHEFITLLDEAVRRHDPDNDLTAAGTTIHVAEPMPDEVQYELRCIGTLRLDADAMGDLKRLLVRAEAQRAWLLPRTLALRTVSAPPSAMAEAGVRNTADRSARH